MPVTIPQVLGSQPDRLVRSGAEPRQSHLPSGRVDTTDRDLSQKLCSAVTDLDAAAQRDIIRVDNATSAIPAEAMARYYNALKVREALNANRDMTRGTDTFLYVYEPEAFQGQGLVFAGASGITYRDGSPGSAAERYSTLSPARSTAHRDSVAR